MNKARTTWIVLGASLLVFLASCGPGEPEHPPVPPPPQPQGLR
jgi:hypothetical protein